MKALPRLDGSWWLALAALLTVAGASAAPAPVAARGPSAAPARLASCAWDRPGHDPYVGDVVAAVDRYPDIPAPVRDRLKQRMAARQYDDIAEISRDHIEGRSSYGPAITDMHFGAGRICSTVTRAGWHADTRERGLVYCEGQECIIVPTVCRNVSRVKRVDQGPAVAEGPLLFDPPGAGMPPIVPVGAPPFGDDSAFAMLPDAPIAFEAPQAGQDRPYGGAPFFGGGGVPGGPIVTSAPTSAGASQPGTGGGADGGGGTTVPGAPIGTGGGGSGPIVVVGTPGITGAVPEPSTWGLLVVGGALLAVGRRRVSVKRPAAA